MDKATTMSQSRELLAEHFLYQFFKFYFADQRHDPEDLVSYGFELRNEHNTAIFTRIILVTCWQLICLLFRFVTILENRDNAEFWDGG